MEAGLGSDVHAVFHFKSEEVSMSTIKVRVRVRTFELSFGLVSSCLSFLEKIAILAAASLICGT